MIQRISTELADRMVKLSPEVRSFCEESSRRIAGDPPRFQTMADAWVYAVLHGLKSGKICSSEMKKTKDAFRWRVVRSEYQSALLLKAYINHVKQDTEFKNLSESPSELISHLERCAHQGVIQISKNE